MLLIQFSIPDSYDSSSSPNGSSLDCLNLIVQNINKCTTTTTIKTAATSPTSLSVPAATTHHNSIHNISNNIQNSRHITSSNNSNFTGMGGNPALKNVSNVRLGHHGTTSVSVSASASATSATSMTPAAPAVTTTHSSLNATFKQKCTT